MSMISTTPAGSVSALPFKGGPDTVFAKDAAGRTCIAVRARALTPLAARMADYAAIAASGAVFIAGSFSLLSAYTVTGEDFATLVVGAIATWPATRLALGQLLKSQARVTFTPDHIEIARLFGTRRFERAHPHAFVLLEHDRAEAEQERHALADRKRPPQWWSRPRRKYCGKSFHVALTCFGERHDVLTVYGRKKATAIQARLRACDAVMDGADFGDGGVTLSPTADWGTEAGGL